MQSWTYPTDDGDGVTGQIVWGPEIAESVADILARGNREPEEKSALEEACEWLSDYLEEHDGRAIAGQLQAAARASGHSERTIRRARKALKIEKSKCGYQGAWEWYIPQAVKAAESPPSPNLDPLAPLPSTSTQTGQEDQRGQHTLSTRARGPFDEIEIQRTVDADPTSASLWLTERTCRCGQPATDISGRCPACLANPGTLPSIPDGERF